MPYRILGDVHTHTFESRHAYSTITENVAAARTAGLELLGSTDHFSFMMYDEPTIKNFQHFLNMRSWPRVWDGVTVLRGAEVDIMNIEGELFGEKIPCPANIDDAVYTDGASLLDRVARRVDYLIASVHNNDFARGESTQRAAQMYVRALEHPKVFILGHTGRAGVPYDLDEVLTVAREKHKLIEINDHSLDFDTDGTFRKACGKIAERCAEMGVGIAVSTDSHLAYGIGRFPRAIELLEEIHFPEELIMNRTAAAFVGELAAAGVCDLADEL